MRIKARLCRLLPALLILAGMLLAVPPAQATKNPDAKLILNLVPWSNKNTCASGRLSSPAQVVTKGDLFPAKYTCYVLVVDGAPGAGIAGIQLGISYNDTLKKGVDILEWQECSLFNWPTPGWPSESGTGNMLTWNQDNDCDTTGIRVIGYFYVTAYSPDRLAVVQHPSYRKAGVGQCGITPQSREAEVVDSIPKEHLGFVDFGGGPGYDPWDPKQDLLLRFRDPGSHIKTREDTRKGKGGRD